MTAPGNIHSEKEKKMGNRINHPRKYTQKEDLEPIKEDIRELKQDVKTIRDNDIKHLNQKVWYIVGILTILIPVIGLILQKVW